MKFIYMLFQEIPEEIIGSPIPEPRQRSKLLRSQSESSDEVTELDLSHGKKDAFVLEVISMSIILVFLHFVVKLLENIEVIIFYFHTVLNCRRDLHFFVK